MQVNTKEGLAILLVRHRAQPTLSLIVMICTQPTPTFANFTSSFVFTFLKTIWEICQQFASFAYHVISESSQSPITLDPLTNRSFGYFTGLGLTLARVYNYATFVFYQTMLVAYSLIYIYQTKRYSFPYPTAIYKYNII